MCSTEATAENMNCVQLRNETLLNGSAFYAKYRNSTTFDLFALFSMFADSVLNKNASSFSIYMYLIYDFISLFYFILLLIFSYNFFICLLEFFST